ncbi:MAG TPA: hypothetical protein VLY83_05475 [Methanoregula sp.]|nr:hypothetical protein [Methanoregula sp.]
MADSLAGDNDPILFRTQKIIINGVPSFAALTGSRILILEGESGPVREEIPFSSLLTVAAGENPLREPILSLSFTVSGEPALRELIFVRNYGGIRAQERDRCLAFLRDRHVPVAGEPPGQETLPEARPAAQEWMPKPPGKNATLPPPEIPRGKSPAYTIAAVIVIAAIVVWAVVFFEPFGKAGQSPAGVRPPGPGGPVLSVTHPQAPTEITTPVTPGPVPPEGTQQVNSPSPGIAAGLVPGATATPAFTNGIPSGGVWVRVASPGSYYGYVGAEGYSVDINSSGERFYQIPIRAGMIEGSIINQNTSGSQLEVGIYRDGSPLFLKSTTVAEGVIDFHVPVPLSGGEITPSVPPAPAPVIATPEPTLPVSEIPREGVWLRVFSASNFTGSAGPAGKLTDINSTGDQFYRMPLVTGMIEGSVEKQDGSGNPLIVAVYRDGALVTRMFTVAPGGSLDLHVTV